MKTHASSSGTEFPSQEGGRLFFRALCALALVAAAGCGSNSTSPATPEPASAKQTAVTPAQANVPDAKGRPPLQLAIEAGDLERMKALVAAGADIHARRQEGEMIHLAASRGNFAAVELLIASGADPQCRTSYSNTPLHVASTREVAELLVGRDLAVDAPNIYRETPLHLACARGHAQVVAFLLEQGADPRARSRDGNTMPLNDAANREVAELLVAAGAPVNGVPNQYGRNLPPIWSAATRGRTDVVAFLLEKGASPDTRSGSGPLDPTLLWTAVDRGHNDTVDVLLEKGAKFTLPGNENLLATAAGKGRTNIVQSFLSHHADPNAGRMVPLAAAAGVGDHGLVAMLLAAGAAPNGPTPERGSPLMDAACGRPPIHKVAFQVPASALSPDNYLLCMKALIAKGADVKAATRGGLTALHSAAGGKFLQGAELLVSLGATVDAKDQYDATPLHWAVINDAVDVAGFLLEHGANPNLPLNPRAAVISTAQGELPNPFGGVKAAGQVPLTLAKSDKMKALLARHGAVAGKSSPLETPPVSEDAAARAAVDAARRSQALSRPAPVAPAGAASIKAGDSEAEVIAALGRPRMRFAKGKRTILSYVDREITLEDGKVIDQ